MKKYKLITSDFKFEYGVKLYRIKANKTFENQGNVIKKGDLGGYIEKLSNLEQHQGNAWIYDNAKVYGNARVSGNAEVYGNAIVYDDVWVWGNAKVYGDARIYGNAWIRDNARVSGSAKVFGDAKVYDDAEVFGDAKVLGKAEVYDNAKVYGTARVFGDAEIYGNAKVYGNAWVYGEAKIFGDAEVNLAVHLKTGQLKIINLINIIKASLDILPINNYYYVYKVINKDNTSLYDKEYIYPNKGIAKAVDPDLDTSASCAKGLHVSTATFWEHTLNKDTKIIACKVHVKDVLCCLEGKLRVSKLTVLGECPI